MILHGFLAHPPKTHLEMFWMILSWFFRQQKPYKTVPRSPRDGPRGLVETLQASCGSAKATKSWDPKIVPEIPRQKNSGCMMTQFICRRPTKHHKTNIFYASKNWYVRLLFLLKFEVLEEVGVCVCFLCCQFYYNMYYQ